MELKSNDYQGKDRRSNGRLKLHLRDWYLIITILVGATLWLGKLQWASSANSDKLEKVEEAPKEIALIKKDVGHILLEQTEMKEDLDEFKTEQKAVNIRFDGKLDRILEKL